MLFLFTLFAAVYAADKGIHLNRTVRAGSGVTGSLVITPEKFCAAKDDWGDNNCNIPWSNTITLDLKTKTPTTLGAKSKLDIDLKVKGLPLKFSCPVCGANCTFEVPIIHLPVSIPLPDCPIPTPFELKTDPIDLPDKSPLGPIKVPITGTAQVHDDTGAVVAKIAIDALLD